MTRRLPLSTAAKYFGETLEHPSFRRLLFHKHPAILDFISRVKENEMPFFSSEKEAKAWASDAIVGAKLGLKWLVQDSIALKTTEEKRAVKNFVVYGVKPLEINEHTSEFKDGNRYFFPADFNITLRVAASTALLDNRVLSAWKKIRAPRLLEEIVRYYLYIGLPAVRGTPLSREPGGGEIKPTLIYILGDLIAGKAPTAVGPNKIYLPKSRREDVIKAGELYAEALAKTLANPLVIAGAKKLVSLEKKISGADSSEAAGRFIAACAKNTLYRQKLRVQKNYRDIAKSMSN